MGHLIDGQMVHGGRSGGGGGAGAPTAQEAGAPPNQPHLPFEQDFKTPLAAWVFLWILVLIVLRLMGLTMVGSVSAGVKVKA